MLHYMNDEVWNCWCVDCLNKKIIYLENQKQLEKDND